MEAMRREAEEAQEQDAKNMCTLAGGRWIGGYLGRGGSCSATRVEKRDGESDYDLHRRKQQIRCIGNKQSFGIGC